MDFRKSLFNQRQPPSSVDRRLHERWLVRINREQIIDRDVLGSAFHIRPDRENTFIIVLCLIEHRWDELASFGQGSNHSDEVIIAHRTLLEIMRRKLAFTLEVLAE